jgi:[glutamine synthetase] adenylyltransferase / [glutamine synthetase]-adenylyl-L-tyrosine phosphorylase
VLEMRQLMDQEKPPKNSWDLKLIPGGLVDIEFMAQHLALVEAFPDGAERPTTTADVLAALGPRKLQADDLETVLAALSLETELSQMMRLCLDGDFDPAEAPAGLIDQLCRTAELPDLKTLEADLKRQAKQVRTIMLGLLNADIAQATAVHSKG